MKRILFAFSAFFLLCSGAHAIMLPTPDCGPTGNCLQFEDATVYSLAYLNFLATGVVGNPGPGDAYYVRSNGDPINNSIVIASSPGGRRDNTDLPLGATLDNAYDTPNSVPAAYVNWVMQASDPNPTFIGDNVQTTSLSAAGQPGLPGSAESPEILDLPLWDIQVSALRDYLAPMNSDLVFFFNLNEENKGGLDDGQDMLAWARIWLTDLDTGASTFYDLSGNLTSPLPNQSQAQIDGQDDILPDAEDMWAHVHGEICVSQSQGLVYLGSCSDAISDGISVPADAKTVNQNLGADIAAFAIYNAELSQLVLDPNSVYDILSVDFRMSRIDNGYEQLFIAPATVGDTPPIPEPATMLLVGSGILGLGGVARRKFMKKG